MSRYIKQKSAGMRDRHKYINNSVMIRQSGSCGVTIQKEPGNIPLPISAQSPG